MRKGQVTIFIIVSLLILSAIVFVLYISNFGKQYDLITPDSNGLHRFVEECLKTTTARGAQLLGIQGGYLNVPTPNLYMDNNTIPYYFYEQIMRFPSRDTLKDNLQVFLQNNVVECLQNFSVFKEMGYSINYGEMKVDISLMDDKVLANANFPVSLEKGDSTITVQEFSADVDSRIGYLHNVAVDITEKTSEDPEFIDMTLLSEYDVEIIVLPYDKENFVYSLSDSKSMFEDQSLVYLFASKISINLPPKLDIPDTLRFADDRSHIYQVKATDPEGDLLTFSDNSALFDITDEGSIILITDVAGTFKATIKVEDDQGNYDEKEIKIIVEEVE